MWAARDVNDPTVDEWMDYLKTSKHGNQLIEMCDNKCGLNPMHIAVVRNKVHLLERLVTLGAGSYV